MDTSVLFFIFLGVLGLQRLGELWLSARNVRNLLAQGAVEHAPGQVAWMSLMHGAWFGACALEVLLGAQFSWTFFAPAAAAFLAGQILRYAAIYALGPRWNVRIVTLPAAPVQTGIYKWIRHPNYAGVALEIAAVPLLHGAWLTAIVFSLINGFFLFLRIRAENKAVYG